MSRLQRLVEMGVQLVDHPVVQMTVNAAGEIILDRSRGEVPHDLMAFSCLTFKNLNLEQMVESESRRGGTVFLYPNGDNPFWNETHVWSGDSVQISGTIRCFVAKVSGGIKPMNVQDRRLLLAM